MKGPPRRKREMPNGVLSKWRSLTYWIYLIPFKIKKLVFETSCLEEKRGEDHKHVISVFSPKIQPWATLLLLWIKLLQNSKISIQFGGSKFPLNLCEYLYWFVCWIYRKQIFVLALANTIKILKPQNINTNILFSEISQFFFGNALRKDT